MKLPRVIKGDRLLLIQMPNEFVQDTWQLGEATSKDFIPHTDWFKEKELAHLRYKQLQKDIDVESWLLRAVVDKTTKQMIGHFNCHDKPNSGVLQRYHNDAIEFGYTIYSEFRRQGYAKEVVATMIDYIHNHHLAKAIVLSAETTNHASLTMIKSLEFKEVDTIRSNDAIEKVFLLKL